ncbi:MAG: response regulator [Myxococcales bacterium]|nr:response regulator [Myxococcales bacterium]
MPTAKPAEANSATGTFRPHIPTLAAAAFLLAAVAAAGWGMIRWTTGLGEDFERERLQRLAETAAASLDPDAVARLCDAASDETSATFQTIRARLQRILQANPDARFVYLLGPRAGRVTFLADAEPPASPQYSRPGDEYPEASPALRAALAAGRSLVEGPATDRWGTWVTGFAPILEPGTRRPLALLGIDIDAGRWLAILDRYFWIGLALAVLFGAVVLGAAAALFFLQRAARRQAALNRSLERELAERRRLEERLREANESLERRVEDRTRELREALDRVRDSEEGYRRLMEAAGEGIVLVRADDGVIEAANAELGRMLGIPREQIVGRSFLFPVPYLEVPRHQRALTDLLRNGHARMRETELRRPDGTPVWVDGTLSTYEARGIRYVLGIVRDVTDRRRAAEDSRRLEERMRQAQKLESLGVLAGGVAHDFGNLLTGILGEAGLARAEVPPGGAADEHLAQIELAAQRAADLTRQLLAYSGRGQFVTRPLDLADLARDTVALLRASIPPTVALRVETPDDLPAVEVDETQLRQVVMNLVLNAAEALGDRPGTVRIALAARELDQAALADLRRDDRVGPGRYVCLEVADDGPGMAPDVQERIFEPFFSTKFAGRGLGLAAVLGIVRGHRGAIGVRSTPGSGAAFTVALPASARPAERSVRVTRSSIPPAERTSSVPPGSRGRALVVDDEPAVRRFAAFILRRMGFDVAEAADGVQALDEIRRTNGQMRLVLLDLTMPRMSGEQVLDEMRRLRPDLPVVLSSGFDAGEVAARTTAHPHVGFIQKPYFPETLETVVNRVLRRD